MLVFFFPLEERITWLVSALGCFHSLLVNFRASFMLVVSIYTFREHIWVLEIHIMALIYAVMTDIRALKSVWPWMVTMVLLWSWDGRICFYVNIWEETKGFRFHVPERISVIFMFLPYSHYPKMQRRLLPENVKCQWTSILNIRYIYIPHLNTALMALDRGAIRDMPSCRFKHYVSHTCSEHG